MMNARPHGDIFMALHFAGSLIVYLLLTYALLKPTIRNLRRLALLPPPPPDDDDLNPLDMPAPSRRPEVGDQPVFWKELYVGGGPMQRSTSFMLLFVCIGWYSLLFWCYFYAGAFILESRPQLVNPREMGQINALLRGMAALLVPPLLWLIALNASGRVSRERERQTLDCLFTTALSRREILFDKWRASIRSFRLLFVGLAPLALLALLTGGIRPEQLCFWGIAVAVFVTFAAWLGLFFSVHCRSTLRASVYTFLTLFGLFVFPLLNEKTLAASPPVALWMLWSRDLGEPPWETEQAIAVFVVAMVGLTLASAFLAWKSFRRFECE
jgi:ABC-type transport system involved in multi-copper enzyme maturation permease subunit